MIRIYLDNAYLEDSEYKTSILVESQNLNVKVSYHHDNNGTNVLAIVEGSDAEKLTAFMLPPYSLNTLISSLSESEITKVTSELNARNINTSGSVTTGDLINNICYFFNVDFKTLGSITNRDFS
jgi:hypothetical protein